MSNVVVAVGSLVLIRYGNGTQAGIVTAIGARGGLSVLRLFGWGSKCTAGNPAHWTQASKMKAGDDRIFAVLPESDPRCTVLRRAAGYVIATMS